MNRHHRIHFRDLEHTQDARLGRDEFHATSLRRYVALCRDQHANAGGVDEGATREVDDDSGCRGSRRNCVLDARAGRHVELTEDAHHDHTRRRRFGSYGKLGRRAQRRRV